MQFLINHKSNIKYTFAIKIITDKNKSDANIILIYVKLYVYGETSYLYFYSDFGSSGGEKECHSLNSLYFWSEMCIYNNYVLCASSCSCYWTYDNTYSKNDKAAHVLEYSDWLKNKYISFSWMKLTGQTDFSFSG